MGRLELRDVNKVYRVGTFGGDTLHAVKDVSFTAEPGRIISLIGESGSGKTQTALAIMGLLPADARVQGEIDAMQGQLDYLDRQVAESTLDLTLQIPAVTPPETRPGPLGYVALGLWKAVKWLFVWED
mgnify:CR=1 FL=1